MTDCPDHYAALGLGRRCSAEQIRVAYRVLAKKFHPDLHDGSEEMAERARVLNAAYEVLSDPARRQAHDRDLAAREASAPAAKAPSARLQRNITHDLLVTIEDLLRGTTLTVRVKDPANFLTEETYPLEIPPDTAPGSRFRLPRAEPFAGGHVIVRVKARPSARFRPRGSDLRTDLRISADRAARGGTESLPGPTGRSVQVEVPAGVGRGAIVRVAGQGLPKPRGGRGDLLVRITYRPEVRVTRGSARF